MLVEYKYRHDRTGTTGWYQAEDDDFKQLWGYIKGGVMWCVVKRAADDHYWYYHSGKWCKLPLTANYNFHK